MRPIEHRDTYVKTDFSKFIRFTGPNEPRWGVNQFPDGQNQFWYETESLQGSTNLIASIQTPEILDIVLQIGHAMSLSVSKMRVAYFYGGRCDKSEAGNRVVVNVAKFTKDQLLEYFPTTNIEVITPHNLESVSGLYTRYPVHEGILSNNYGKGYDVIVFPDEGATKRFSSLTFWKSPVIVTGRKERGQVSGDILFHSLDSTPLGVLGAGRKGVKFLLMDDLCDGGRTFTDLAKVIHQTWSEATVDLYVTHGLFTNGAVSKLREAGIERIWTTNSVPDGGYRGHTDVVVKDVWDLAFE